MLITKLVEEMKYNQGTSFLSEVELIIKRRIRPKFRIHTGKISIGEHKIYFAHYYSNDEEE